LPPAGIKSPNFLRSCPMIKIDESTLVTTQVIFLKAVHSPEVSPDLIVTISNYHRSLMTMAQTPTPYPFFCQLTRIIFYCWIIIIFFCLTL
jgi:hypothetical protein